MSHRLPHNYPMKNIEQRGESCFRAHVYRLGLRRSATFRTLQEAQSWVNETKWKLRTKVGGEMLSAEEIMSMPREKIARGVYFLFNGNELVYVGQSTNVYERIIRHKRRLGGFNGKFDSFGLIRCEQEKLLFLERYYIDLLKPRLNALLPKFYRGKTIIEKTEMATLQAKNGTKSRNELSQIPNI